MPNGRTHDNITWFLTAPVLYATWHLTRDWTNAAIATSTFVFAGLMFSGDLDLKSVQYHRWGMVRWIWKPYQWLVPHRSALSHGLILGPAGRLAYLTLVVAGLAWAALSWWAQRGGALTPTDAFARTLQGLWNLELGAREWAWVGCAMAGLWVGGASHTLADWASTAWKRLFRRRR